MQQLRLKVALGKFYITIRDYNEDRVSIIYNIAKPQSYKGDDWPKCSFFGLYDGHGGSRCADYLRDNLHKFVSLLNYR
jgi:protein phosphatase 2C family protein 2/3